ncbi:hypothetical protein [Streptomyces sp. NPDC001927]
MHDTVVISLLLAIVNPDLSWPVRMREATAIFGVRRQIKETFAHHTAHTTA